MTNSPLSRRAFLRLAGMTAAGAALQACAPAAWHQIFTLGQAPVEQMRPVCQQIQEAQE